VAPTISFRGIREHDAVEEGKGDFGLDRGMAAAAAAS